MQHQILFKHIFWSNYRLSIFYLKSLTSGKSILELNIWTPSGYFPFLISFFCLNEINKNLQEKTRERPGAVTSACKCIKKETLPQAFSCEFCEISKNTFSNKTPPVAVSERWKIVKRITMQRTCFTQVTGNRASDHYAKKCLYKGLSINSCSVDVSATKNTSSKQQIRSKIPTVSAVQVFSTELRP